MDKGTALFYEQNAVEIAARYEQVPSPVERLVQVAFPGGSSILDVGMGSGRDLAMLLRRGYDAFGVEPSEALRTHAQALHPETQGRVWEGSLPNLSAPQNREFDGIVCSAVLMHLPEGDLFDAALSLRRLLKTNGRLLLSLPEKRSDVQADERDANGRLFKSYASEFVSLLFERLGFQRIGFWTTKDALGREGTSWYTLLLELRTGGSLRAVDQIEGILNRDRKVATYKLALFRALAQIALQEAHTVSWNASGDVGVPIAAIAERWLLYFWPVFASARFIPQSQSEGKGEQQPVAFRAALTKLISEFKLQGAHGGLTAWQLARMTGKLTPEVQGLLRDTLSVIAATIKDGPVRHSGGALESGPVFRYDTRTRQVLMSAELWRELSLLGHWITDAVIVRWAALTERFAHRQGITSGDVLPLLLASPEPERAAGLARGIFLSRGATNCVWSRKSLTSSFAVDHVIAFSLWGSNDLWNLLPVDPKVNNQKSDMLPSAALLRRCEVDIVQAWRLLREEVPVAFDQQAARLLGRGLAGPLQWESDLLGRLREAVELTALQRGVARWEPLQSTANVGR